MLLIVCLHQYNWENQSITLIMIRRFLIYDSKSSVISVNIVNIYVDKKRWLIVALMALPCNNLCYIKQISQR